MRPPNTASRRRRSAALRGTGEAQAVRRICTSPETLYYMVRSMDKNHRSTFILRIIGLLAIIIFMGSVIWSLWFDTLLPFIKQKNYIAVGLELVGFSVAWLGVGFAGYSTLIIIRNTIRLFSEKGVFQSNLEIVQRKHWHLSEQVPSKLIWQARKENFIMLWNAWKPGLAWMALGWMAIAIGGFFMRLAEGNLSYR